ncbi:hypothetical protein ABEB36_014512 [Hypothenemus hampei]|uniref:Uncharacterized protein n=1 Tax=Hypothenemus hampei TaxID=57062 RepID=A0ABD1E2B1_HYPHA
MLRFIHYVVHSAKRLKRINVMFPVRGHSYLECDRNMAMVNQKVRAEVLEDWYQEFESCRKKPSSFQVIEVEQNLIRDWSTYFTIFYKKKCPFPIRPIKEFEVSRPHYGLVRFRNSYNGSWETSAIIKYQDLQQLKPFCRQKARDFFKNIPYKI